MIFLCANFCYIIDLDEKNYFFHLIMKMMKEQKEERIKMVEVVQELNNIKVYPF